MTVSNEELMAYADGELAGADKARVEAALAADPALRAALEKHRRLNALLQTAYAPVLDEPVPERLTDAARAQPQVEAPVIDIDAARARRAAGVRAWRVREWGAIAAALIVGVLVGGQTLGRGGLIGEDMMAQGVLARALDTQLASDAGRPVHIGLTVLTADGGACRTFAADRGALQGLACHEDGAWRIDLAVRGEQLPANEFRMAGVQTPAPVLARVEQIAGADGALDAAGERAARDRRWKTEPRERSQTP